MGGGGYNITLFCSFHWQEEEYANAGYTNGLFGGLQPFTCPENSGMFESLDKLAPTANHATLMKQAPQPKANTKAPTDDLGSDSSPTNAARPVTRSQTHGQKQKQQSQADNPPSQFKIGDRVVAHDKDQHAIHGTVKWIGHAFGGGVRVSAVGIETVIVYP